MSAIANVARENEEIIKLKEDLLNERERHKQLEHNMHVGGSLRKNTMKSKMLKSVIKSLEMPTECSQPCEIITNFECPIVSSDGPIVASDHG